MPSFRRVVPATPSRPRRSGARYGGTIQNGIVGDDKDDDEDKKYDKDDKDDKDDTDNKDGQDDKGDGHDAPQAKDGAGDPRATREPGATGPAPTLPVGARSTMTTTLSSRSTGPTLTNARELAGAASSRPTASNAQPGQRCSTTPAFA